MQRREGVRRGEKNCSGMWLLVLKGGARCECGAGRLGGNRCNCCRRCRCCIIELAHLHGAGRSVHHTNADIAAGGGVTQVKNRDMRHVSQMQIGSGSSQGRVRVASWASQFEPGSNWGRVGVKSGQVRSRSQSLPVELGCAAELFGGCSGYNGAESMVECRALYRWIYKR